MALFLQYKTTLVLVFAICKSLYNGLEQFLSKYKHHGD